MPPKPDVRRLFNKSRTERKTTKQIQHPLAKYDTQGRLTCILCTIPIKNEAVWPSHLSSATHKQTVAKLKQLKEAPQSRPKDNASTGQRRKVSERESATTLVGYGGDSDEEDEEEDDEQTGQQAKRQRLEKDASNSEDDMDTDEQPQSNLPPGFFDQAPETSSEPVQDTQASENVDQGEENKLPAGFFDDPEADAKARNAPAPAEQQEADLDHEYELFKEAVAEDEQAATVNEVIDEEELWRDRDEDLERQQEELVARVGDLKRIRNEGGRGAISTNAPKANQFGEDDTNSRELKSSVRDYLKQAYNKKSVAAQKYDNFMDEDEESEDEDEDDWRAQQLI
ncbi:hypothetical protein NQZ79_g5583 [Umbelopsis isabellina]|nr:hypothetical protein NQZ79_g5583 [Umbelopsis isabellina]